MLAQNAAIGTYVKPDPSAAARLTSPLTNSLLRLPKASGDFRDFQANPEIHPFWACQIGRYASGSCRFFRLFPVPKWQPVNPRDTRNPSLARFPPGFSTAILTRSACVFKIRFVA